MITVYICGFKCVLCNGLTETCTFILSMFASYVTAHTLIDDSFSNKCMADWTVALPSFI
jgi:hypothetical protein